MQTHKHLFYKQNVVVIVFFKDEEKVKKFNFNICIVKKLLQIYFL